MEIEPADIPSDNESVDGLCSSDDEREDADIINVKKRAENFDFADDGVEADDLPDVPDEISQVNEKWEEKRRLRDDLQFTKDFGPNIADTVTSPIDVFFCLFPESLIDILVEQTNLYRVQRESQQREVSKIELLTFLGINILMGIKKPTSYRDCWSMNPQLHDSYVSKLMTVNRFGFFLSHLHLNDNTKEPKRGSPGYDKLYKIRPMVTILNETFKSCYKPKQNQSVDESMIKFKGRSSMKQYMPAKPVKRGYKCWVRADESSFVCEFQVYTGKTESTEKLLGPRVVKDLTRELT
ncbi:piggyBac transposable element-derived protein 4-like [Anastrepha obliqua]|uniref:piggyBac transposable element-derived protein 4-like n=1 Tax=Anastrepha obliqua TaxID=95512 RepID=UPI00240926D2|nr:piggyBac transposable element-derived protein 4-like [Anastrepha obliqua]